MKNYRLRFLFILLIILLHNDLTNGQSHWMQRADFPASRGGVSPFSIGAKGYFACGIDNAPVAYNDLWEYDPVANTWTQMASLPASDRYSASGFSMGNFGYVCLGWDINGVGLNDLWQYDPTLNSWNAKANFPGSARYNSIAFVVSAKAYVGLGYVPVQNDIYEYDPATNTWTVLVNAFPGGARTTATSFSCTYSIAGTTYEKGFVGTGSLNPDLNTILANDLWEFTPGVTPGSGTWLAKSNFPGSGRFSAFSFSLYDRGYIGGGVGLGLTKLNDFYEYDPVTDTWAVKDSFPGINSAHARGFTINNIGYSGTGSDLTANYPFFYRYAPAVAPIIQLSSSDTSFCDKKCLDFFDLSTNNPTSWQWFFPGADSAVSLMQNPTNICYNNYGNFDVTLIACNAAGCDTLLIPSFINEYALPVASITQSNDTLIASVGLGYQWWSVDSGIITGATNHYFVPIIGGDYFVIVYDSIGCGGTSNVISITGIEQITPNNFEVIVKPDPNDGQFSISLEHVNVKEFLLRIFNSTGQVVFTQANFGTCIKQQTVEVDLGNNDSGLYLLETVAGNKIYCSRFIVQR